MEEVSLHQNDLSTKQENEIEKASIISFLKKFWITGFIGFGGPQAHVALMHSSFVDTEPRDEEGKIVPHLAEDLFLELYALCQSLPGPGSTQLATSLGATFGGFFGGILTFFIFMIPGFIIMSTAGLIYHRNLETDALQTIKTVNEYLVGLIAAAFAMVVVSSFKIITKCCADNRVLYGICICTTIVSANISPDYASFIFVSLLVSGGLVSVAQKFYLDSRNGKQIDDDNNTEEVLKKTEEQPTRENWKTGIPRWTGTILIVVFLIGTVTALVTPVSRDSILFRILKVFWTIGAIGFGGGVVVIPMLLNEVVDKNLLDESVFLAGFALIGIAPGPMFNLAAFLGAALASWPGLLPFWERLRKVTWVRTFVFGVNAAASGLILTGVYMVLNRIAIGPASFSLAVSAGVLMTVFKVSSPIAIIIHGIAGAFFRILKIGGPFQ